MTIASFLKNVQGSMPVVMALTAIPLLVAAGSAIDMVHANSAQTALQAEVDAAALAGGTSKLSGNDLKNVVRKYVKANAALASAEFDNSDISYGTVSGSTNFYVKVEAKMPTSFLGIVGIPTLDISAYSEVDKGGQAMELALVLDNTASMNSEGRLAALKTSAKLLVNTVLDNTPPGAYVKIGIAPFSNYVNVGINNRHSSWVDVIDDYTETTAQSYNSYPNATYTNCHLVDHPYLNDGVPAVWQENVCDVNPGTPVLVTYYPTHTWNGCVGSRNSPLDVTVASPGIKYPGIMDVSCPSAVTDLTSDKTTLISQIDGMVANNETYIPAGLVWGWNLLDSNAPFTTAKNKAQMLALKGTKSLVLMTDGDNTLSPTYPTHNGNDAAMADNLTDQLCNNIKAEGISVYTVGFKVTKPSSVTLLQNCASNPSQAYVAADDAALAAAFSEIAGSLAQVRVVQ
ncbi:MAG: VWA domain-containing protein [Alphaproteobacteria bacterium]|nr:VWA domain-containing protein [Alphaproteobacteria bacterium]